MCNLSVPPKRLNYADFLMPFELLYKQITNIENVTTNETDPIGAAIKDAAFDCLHGYDPKLEQNLPPAEYNALKTLLKEDNIVIQKSDKGNSVVILDKQDYTDRMNQLLADETKFKKLSVKPDKEYNFVINQELRISKALKSIRDRGAMTDARYQRLNPTGTQPSVLYGLAKVHKPLVNNIPKLRPILSAINTPTYKLSQYMNQLLKPFTTNEYTAKDSFSFANDIRSEDPNNHMSSLDVDSLFTNIPLTETIKICADTLFESTMIVDGLTKDDFTELLTLATTESFILFNGAYYQQIDGVAMGSPLGPTLANIFLGHNEVKWLTACPAEFKPLYYRRYVDDIFLLFSEASQIDLFMNYMNKQHRNMNFTSENEADESLPFLDVFVTRTQTCFLTSVYRKPTFSGVYTNFDSYIPMIYKSGLVSTLLYRSFTICTNWNQIDHEIKKIKSFLSRNGYPSKLLDRLVSIFLNNVHKNNTDNAEEQHEKLQITLPYLGTFTKRLEKKIKQSIQQHLPNIRINFIYRASTRLRTLFTFKDKIPSNLISGIIYKFKCSRCNSTYIGESIRHTKRRFCEHLGVSALSGKTMLNPPPSRIRDHKLECNCNPALKDFKIIGRDSISEHRLLIKESLFIHRDKPSLNIHGASTPLILFKN